MLDAGRRGGPLQHEGRGGEGRESEHGVGAGTKQGTHANRHQGALSRLAVSTFEVGGASPRAFSRDIMAPKRKAPEEENDAPPAFLLKTKRFVVNLARIKGSMGLGIDDQHTAMFKARWRRLGPAGAPEATVSARSSRWLPQAPASLRQSAARSALAGHIGLLFDAGIT